MPQELPQISEVLVHVEPEEELAAKGIARDMRVVHFFRQKKMLPVSKAEDNEIPKKHSTRVEEARKSPIPWWRPSLVAVPQMRAVPDAVPFASVTFRLNS